MIGSLPLALDVGGKRYDIRADFRSVLRIVAAFADDELTTEEKIYVCLRQMYKDFDKIPTAQYAEAYKQAVWFISCGQEPSEKPSPRVVDWGKDEQLIFPAVNKVAGQEVRAVPFFHWWTFMGCFQSIDREDTYGYILMLRQKKAKGKKLEKWEQEYWNNNREICDLNGSTSSGQEAENALAEIYKELLQKGG